MRKILFWLLFLLSINAFAQSKGLMIHFLPEVKNAVDRVKLVDADLIAKTVSDVGADYLIFTIGQNTGQYVSKNKALVKHCPFYADRELDRDVIDDLVFALSKYDKKLILYLPFRAPQRDSQLALCLGDKPERTPTTKEFVTKWSDVVGEWGNRYGDVVIGWWFDGTYNTTGIESEDWKRLCNSALGVNKKRLIAFNPGEGVSFLRAKLSPCQNLVAGEINNINTLMDTYYDFSEGVKPHVLSRVTGRWGGGEAPQFDCKTLDYVSKEMTRQGGMLTIDVGYREGVGFFDSQISLIKNAWVFGCK